MITEYEQSSSRKSGKSNNPDLVEQNSNSSFDIKSMGEFSILCTRTTNSGRQKLNNREIRVFISSTFNDMNEEREYLVKHVFPHVKEECLKRDVGFTEIDLRWGITEDEAKAGQAVDICLSEIERCKNYPPFFIGILGERYGWIPRPEELASIFPDFALSDFQQNITSWKNNQISVTEMEFRYSLMLKNRKVLDSLFYLRSNALTREISLRSGLNNEALFFDDVDGKLHRFKSYLSSTENKSIILDGYRTVEEFGESVKERLLFALEQRFPKDGLFFDPVMQNNANFARDKLNNFVVRQSERQLVLGHCRKRLAGEERRLCVIHGASGTGKSTLMADLARYLPNQFGKANVFAYYLGNDDCLDLSQWRRSLISQLTQYLPEEEDYPVHYSEDELWFYVSKLLNVFNYHYKLPFIITLDAVDQLKNPDDALRKIQEILFPTSALVIISSTTNIEFDSAIFDVFTCGNISVPEKVRIIDSQATHYRKFHSDKVFNTILSSKETSLPLYLNIVLEELRLRYSHNRLDIDLSDMLVHNDIVSLVQYILTVLDREFSDSEHTNIVTRLIAFLSASHSGLDEGKLGTLLAVESDGISGYDNSHYEVVKSFWPRVYSISNTDIPIHSGSVHRYMNAA